MVSSDADPVGRILEASGLSMGALERLRDDITNVRERLLAADPAVVGDIARAGARRRATSDGAKAERPPSKPRRTRVP